MKLVFCFFFFIVWLIHLSYIFCLSGSFAFSFCYKILQKYNWADLRPPRYISKSNNWIVTKQKWHRVREVDENKNWTEKFKREVPIHTTINSITIAKQPWTKLICEQWTSLWCVYNIPLKWSLYYTPSSCRII